MSIHLIIGGNGFLGRHMAVSLAKEGHDVVIVDPIPASLTFPVDVQDRIFWKALSIQDADWDVLLKDVHTLHYYAWSSTPAIANADPVSDLTLNGTSTLIILEALRRLGAQAPRLVFLSSGGTVYGKLHRIPVPEGHQLAPIAAYGAGKVTAEVYLGLYRSLYDLDIRVARLANPFGAGQNIARRLGAVTIFLHQALLGQPIQIWGNGEVIRDYIHISDVILALQILGQAPRTDGPWIFNIGSGIGISLNDIVIELEVQLERRLEVEYFEQRPFDVPINVLDISLVHTIFGWRPLLSFSEGMALTLSDLKRNAIFSTLH